MKNMYLGIDIGGTAVKIGLVDEAGTILAAHSYSVSFDNYQTPILETVLKSTELFLEANTLDNKSLTGIGISATGQIDTRLGIVAGCGGNIKNWEGTDLKTAFSDQYHLPVTVVNDANCVALGEKWVGRAKDISNAIVLTIGTGLGGGIIVNNQILLGSSGFAGEIGHFSIHHQGLPCTCGNAGCFEQYASMTALVKLATAYYEATDPDYLLNHSMNGKTIFEAVANGDSGMLQIVNAWIHSIATGIVSLVHIFNPELVVIGGGVSTQEELFILKLKTEVMQQVMPNFRNSLKLGAAALGNNAGLVGAVYYLLVGLKQNNI